MSSQQEKDELQIWREDQARRIDELERRLDKNTESINRVEANTKEVVEILQSWKGAMNVLEFLGKLAKPLGALTAIVAAYTAWKTQK